MTQKILDALKALDVENSNHWTADGLPRLDTVKMQASDQSITREDVEKAAPGFKRDNATTWTAPEGDTEDNGDSNAGEDKPEGESGNDEQVGEGEGDTGTENDEQVEDEQVGQPLPDTDLLDHEELLEAVRQQEEKVEEIRTARHQIEVAFNHERQVLDDLRARAERVSGKSDTNQDAIGQYLEAQKAKLQQRGNLKQAIAESGINLAELSKSMRSPIDSSRQRKGR